MTGTPASNMERLWGMICSKYSLLKTENQYGGLRLSNFIDPENPHKAYPKLKGRGGEVKDLVRPLLLVWRELMTKGNQEHRMIEAMFENHLDLQTILHQYRKEAFLPPAVAKQVQVGMDAFLMRYSILAKGADKRKELLWATVPKHHWA